MVARVLGLIAVVLGLALAVFGGLFAYMGGALTLSGSLGRDAREVWTLSPGLVWVAGCGLLALLGVGVARQGLRRLLRR